MVVLLWSLVRRNLQIKSTAFEFDTPDSYSHQMVEIPYSARATNLPDTQILISIYLLIAYWTTVKRDQLQNRFMDWKIRPSISLTVHLFGSRQYSTTNNSLWYIYCTCAKLHNEVDAKTAHLACESLQRSTVLRDIVLCCKIVNVFLRLMWWVVMIRK